MNAPRIGAARFIGQRMPRKEDARLLTGRGTFVDDVVLPGMLHVAFVRSPIARGRIRLIDTSAALGMPGVRAILTAADLARLKVQMFSFFMMPVEVETPMLATDRVAYVGDPVVMIVAQDRYIAEDAASLVVVDYEEEEAVVTIEDAKHGPPVHPGTESNLAAAMGVEEDEPLEALLASAPHLVTGTLTHQRISQSPMETRGVVVSKQGEGELTLYITCQSPHLVARYVSLALGLPPTSIRVIAKDVGGSFGLKNHPWKEEMAVIAAGIILGRPIKWIEDRLENLTAANQAREQEITLRIAFDAEGRLLASHSNYDLNNGAYPQGADANIAVQMFMWSAYKMPAFGFHTKGWYTNTVGLCAYRGPWAIELLARETLLDVAARQIGIDPIEVPPPQPHHQGRSALHHATRDTTGGHHPGGVPGEAAGNARRARVPRGTGGGTQAGALPRPGRRDLHRADRLGRQHACHDRRTGAGPDRADRQGHGDAQHPFAGARY